MSLGWPWLVVDLAKEFMGHRMPACLGSFSWLGHTSPLASYGIFLRRRFFRWLRCICIDMYVRTLGGFEEVILERELVLIVILIGVFSYMMNSIAVGNNNFLVYYLASFDSYEDYSLW